MEHTSNSVYTSTKNDITMSQSGRESQSRGALPCTAGAPTTNKKRENNTLYFSILNTNSAGRFVQLPPLIINCRMYNVYCVVCSVVSCMIFSALCRVYWIVHTAYCIQYTLYIIHKQYTLHYTVHSIHYTIHHAVYSLYIV